MDERFRSSRLWIILGALGVLFLCLMLCGLVTMAFGVMRFGPAYGAIPQAPPAPGAEGATPPQVYYSPWAVSGPVGFVAQGVGLLLKLAFVGLFVLLFIGLIRRLLWGPRRCGPGYWGRPPAGHHWKGKTHPGWGPWIRHWHGEPPEHSGEPASPEDEPEDPDLTYRGAE